MLNKEKQLTPPERWRLENPSLYRWTVDFQHKLSEQGIAWHNPLANECVLPDRGCCTRRGDYTVRISKWGDFIATPDPPMDERMPKRDMKHDGIYLNKGKAGAVRVGQWDSQMGAFVCIKPPEYGRYTVCTLPHFEDDLGTAVFEPIERLF